MNQPNFDAEYMYRRSAALGNFVIWILAVYNAHKVWRDELEEPEANIIKIKKTLSIQLEELEIVEARVNQLNKMNSI